MLFVNSTMGYWVPSLPRELPLDMALDSVDDAYTTCTKGMSKVISKYLDQDKQSNEDFKAAWDTAQKNNRNKNPGHGLTENHAIAIRVYVSGQSKIYGKFNAAVRSSRNVYKTTFNYHALHFLLTDALKHLKEDQGKCVTTYRGTQLEFNTKNVVNKEMRFGSFTSSSRKRVVATNFGTKSCFVIRTCHGAFLGDYSHLRQEEEVLIPPYEKFKVVSVKKNQWCDVVYSLNSTGIISNLDCALM